MRLWGCWMWWIPTCLLVSEKSSHESRVVGHESRVMSARCEPGRKEIFFSVDRWWIRRDLDLADLGTPQSTRCRI